MMKSRILVMISLLNSGAAFSQDQPIPESVYFLNEDIRLVGELYLPTNPGPHPTVIFTHGSGGAGRDNSRYQLEATYFAEQGIASLVFDKRGYGESGGDWRTATFEDLASDAVAAVDYLKSRNDIDVSRLGLRGASQSGWILPLAAIESADVRYLILISPAGMTPYDQILYDVRTDVEDAGFSPRDAEQALTVIESGLAYSRTLDNWDRHEDVLRNFEGKEWLSIASGPPVPDHWMWTWIRPLLDFDSVPIAASLDIPVLVILGEDDREAASQVAGFRFEKAFHDSQSKRLVRYFPNASHSLRTTVDLPEDVRPPIVDGYLETMRDWILNSSNQ
jgi:pimeloyl-ACP methyl ester carboxylesterase